MIPELGQFALVLALLMSLAQATLPLAGAHWGNRAWMAMARPAAAGQFVFVALAFGILAHAFLNDDFSVLYVAMNSNSALPAAYKFAAVWGGHEGSLLLWILILAVWTLAVSVASQRQPEAFASRVIGVLGIVSFGVILFTLATSNPFERLIPAAFDGNDLNPLLQDPAMVAHPPMLYVGYVGMAVPFAFAVAALLTGRLDRDWARWTRPWTVMAWVFLTGGISLGSWWAYYELGWGGWWFWDPVENASFMPWLVGAALIHSLAVTERRGIFKSWTVLLAIAAFSLSLLGTFLVRSGVLISVHAFASDPARGIFILALLALISGGALVLYAFRAQLMESEGGFKLLSREAFLLLNNILLVAAAMAVLVGTLYPMFHQVLGFGQLSVGPPWFNAVFVLFMLPLAFLLGTGMHTFWKRTNAGVLRNRLLAPALAAAVLGVLVPVVFYGGAGPLMLVASLAGFWVVAAALRDPVARLVRRSSAAPMTRAHWGMTLAHLGVGVFIIGATIVSTFNVETDVSARPGDTLEVGGYEFVFRGMSEVEGANFVADQGEFELRRDGELVTMLYPQKRVYRVRQSPMTEAAIDETLARDVFVALGDPLGGTAWSMRIQVKPLISLIWIGCLLMAAGGVLAATDRRYRVRVSEPRAGEDEAAPSDAAPARST